MIIILLFTSIFAPPSGASEIVTLVKQNNSAPVNSTIFSKLTPKFAKTANEVNDWVYDDWFTEDSDVFSYSPISDQRWEDLKLYDQDIGFFLDEKRVPLSVYVRDSLDIVVISKDWVFNATLAIDKFVITESNGSWYHFTLQRKSDTIQVLSDDKVVQSEKIDFKGPYWLFVVTPDLDSTSCKVHNYEFKWSNTTSIAQQESYVNVPFSDNLCLSMYVSITKHSILQVTLTTDNAVSTKKVSGFNAEEGLKKWKKFVISTNSPGTGKLSFFRMHETNEKHGYWAIDDIRFCDGGTGRSDRKLSIPKIAENDTDKFSRNNCSKSTVGICTNGECKCVLVVTTSSQSSRSDVLHISRFWMIGLGSFIFVTFLILVVILYKSFYRLYPFFKSCMFKKSHNSNNNSEATVPLNGLIIEKGNDMDVNAFLSSAKSLINSAKLQEEYNNMVKCKNNTTTQFQEIYESFYFIDVKFINDVVKKAYMVTKVPERDKIAHFWKNVWDQNVKYIILIDDIYSRRKTGNYWTEKNENLQCGDISVQLYLSEFFGDYEYRKFILVNQEHYVKNVEQLRLISWSDNKHLNFLNLVPFFQILSTIPLSSSSPILVHSWDEFDGTSFVLLCDMCLRIAKRENTVNIPTVCKKLSYYSTNLMISSVERYSMAYLVILETLSHLGTSVQCERFDSTKKTLVDEKELEDQKDFLKEVRWRDEFMETMKTKTTTNYARVSIPYRMPFLPSNTLNITIVDGYRCPGQFILTQRPAMSDTGDFWKLIAERNITTIVSLNEIPAQGFDFRPNEKHPLVRTGNSLFVKFKENRKIGCFDWMTVQLQKLNDETFENQFVDIISMKDWKPEMICPQNNYNFVKFCADSERIFRKSSSVVVTCCDGVTASGLYIAMMYNMEKMKQEQVCDVCTSVRNVRFYCPKFVERDEQFYFLWEAAMIYMQEFRLYDNFT